jgi:hypothetical protein
VQEMVRHYGQGFDWQHTPLNMGVVHASGGGRTHGRGDHYFLNFVIPFN